MLYTTNEDVPGIIGTLGKTMGENGVNIANFTLGPVRRRAARRSRCSIVDDPIDPAIVLQAGGDRACSSRSSRCSST